MSNEHSHASEVGQAGVRIVTYYSYSLTLT